MGLSQAAVQAVVDQVTPVLWKHQQTFRATTYGEKRSEPFILGLSGLQGSGKSTWASAIAKDLRERHHLKVINVSLDDFYHTHDNLLRIHEENRSNPLFMTRGQPGTHDETLANNFFHSLTSGFEIRVPAFDKSRFSGEGDRVPEDQWERISQEPQIDVVIFEGWCVGFQALDPNEVEKRWKRSTDHLQTHPTTGTNLYPTDTIGQLKLQDVLTINRHLQVYNDTFMGRNSFDLFIHLDTEDLQNVYHWRIDQEHASIKAKGAGMSDDAVIAFVKGYMPGYELFLEGLREAKFGKTDTEGRKLSILLDSDRTVKDVKRL